MAAEDDNFFSRWSRRKVQVRTGQPLPADLPVAPAAVAATVPGTAAIPSSARRGTPGHVADQEPPQAPARATVAEEPPPTMEDVARLTPEADFKPFMARQVPAEVRNAAVKKLFADPHFNIMDGLDIYIDDYSKPSPLSAADMARMVGAQFLKLVDDPNELKPVAVPGAPVPQAGATAADAIEPTARSTADSPAPALDGTPSELSPEAANAAAPDQPESQDDHADLQLQPDHAPERESPGRGAG